MSTIKELRSKVNKVDAAIIKKLATRTKLIKKIGALKTKSGKKITDKKREQELMQFYQQISLDYQLDPIFIKKLFKLIIAESRRAQNCC
jgi:chorismate mutase